MAPPGWRAACRARPVTAPRRLALDAAGDVILNAEDAAALLGAPLEAFLRDLRAGHVYSLVERGQGEDAGRIRATLRRRAREIRLVIDAATGEILEQ